MTKHVPPTHLFANHMCKFRLCLIPPCNAGNRNLLRSVELKSFVSQMQRLAAQDVSLAPVSLKKQKSARWVYLLAGSKAEGFWKFTKIKLLSWVGPVLKRLVALSELRWEALGLTKKTAIVFDLDKAPNQKNKGSFHIVQKLLLHD